MTTAATLQTPYLSEAEYLDGEKISAERHEYVAGHTYLMAGSSKRHNRIARNFINALSDAANSKDCEIYFSDIKVRVEKYKAYYYPDVVISCEQDDDPDDYSLTNPCVIIEVASDSTIRKDYLEKSFAYQSIPSLRAYLIVAQDKMQVDILMRDEKGEWQLQKLEQRDSQIYLPCLESYLSLEAIYQKVFS